MQQKMTELKCEQYNPSMVLNDEQLPPRIDKYDYMVPNHLLRTAYVYNQLNVAKAINILNSLN